jgi:hypothetical protein
MVAQTWFGPAVHDQAVVGGLLSSILKPVSKRQKSRFLRCLSELFPLFAAFLCATRVKSRRLLRQRGGKWFIDRGEYGIGLRHTRSGRYNSRFHLSYLAVEI